jgi:hypothetical protein
MTEEAGSLEKPDEIRDADGERSDGRPTGGDKTGEAAGIPHEAAPTVAPEEEGGTPTTEHAPGGDL